MYDPTIGRWLSADPIGFKAGDANLYRYVQNSPINTLDDNGLMSVKVVGPGLQTVLRDEVFEAYFGFALSITDKERAAVPEGEKAVLIARRKVEWAFTRQCALPNQKAHYSGSEEGWFWDDGNTYHYPFGDGETVFAYVPLVNFSTWVAVGNVSRRGHNESREDYQSRIDAHRNFKSIGSISVAWEGHLVTVPKTKSPSDFGYLSNRSRPHDERRTPGVFYDYWDHNPYRTDEAGLTFTSSISTLSVNITIAWNACDGTVTVKGSSLDIEGSTQRQGRAPATGDGTTYWLPDEEGVWKPVDNGDAGETS